MSETQAAALHGRFGGSGGPGAWLKDRVATPQGERTYVGPRRRCAARRQPAGRAALRVRRRRPPRNPRLARRPAASTTTAPGTCATPASPAGTAAPPAPTACRRWSRSRSPTTPGAARSRRASSPSRCCRWRRMSTIDLFHYIRHLAEQRADRAAAPHPVLEACPLSLRLPGDGGAGAALRLPACSRRRHRAEGVRRHHARHQLRPAQQRRRPPRPAAATGRPGSSPRRRALPTSCFRWPPSAGWSATDERRQPLCRPCPCAA